MLYGDKARKVIKNKIIKHLLPDTCMIYPRSGSNPVMSEDGIMTTDEPIPISYKGSVNIPCRFDVSGSFRPDKLKNQTIDIEEFYLILPHDMTTLVKNEYHVHYRDNVYEIRRINDISDFDTYVQCQLSWVSARTTTETPTIVALFDYTFNNLQVSFVDESYVSTPVSWAWNFGDGNTSTIQNPVHTYATAGSKTVSLVATDAGANEDTFQLTFSIPSTSFSYVVSALSVTFTAITAGATAWAWDFGDGNTSTLQNPVHTYAASGSYTVTLTATYPKGTGSSGQLVVADETWWQRNLAVATANIVSAHELNGDVLDDSINGFDGTLVGTTSYNPNSFEVGVSALTTTSGGGVQLQTLTHADHPSALGSLSFWAKVSSWVGEQWFYMVEDSANFNTMLIRHLASGEMQVMYRVNGSVYSQNFVITSYKDTAWHFYTWNWNAAQQEAEFYIDGNLIGTFAFTPAITFINPLNPNRVTYGGFDIGTFNSVKGDLYGYTLRNVELTPVQISALAVK